MAIFSCAIHFICYVLAFINLPAKSSFKSTDDVSYIIPNVYVAFIGSFLFGFGDAFFNTQIYSVITLEYATDTCAALALFTFFYVSILIS